MPFKRQRPPVGARPGTLAIPEDAVAPRITVFRYGESTVDEREITDLTDLEELRGKGGTLWIDVQGLGSEEVLTGIGGLFGMHPLVLEDVVHTPQRPKAEHYGDYALLIARMLHLGEELELGAEQLSVVLGSGWVVTFQERYGDVLDPVRRRIRDGLGRIRGAGAGYLAYAIVDTVVDGYFPIIEEWSLLLDRLEDRVLVAATPELLEDLNHLKRDLLSMRRVLSPQREALNRLVRDESELFPAEERLFLRDTYDHCVQLTEISESQRELISGLQNTYLSVVSNRMNEVMKVLTIMASIFIPLTFFAGVYGMNFEHMPELHYRWAYPSLLVLMLVTVIGMVFFFRRRGWLGPTGKTDRRTGG